MCPSERFNHRLIRQRTGKDDVRHPGQIAVSRIAYRWIGMNDAENFKSATVRHGEISQGRTDVAHRLAEIFPTVEGDNEHSRRLTLTRIRRELLPTRWQMRATFVGGKSPERIDDGVARDDDLAGRNIFPTQIATRLSRRSKMEISQYGGNAPVEFFRKRIPFFRSPEPRFDVAEAHAMVSGGEAGTQDGRGVSGSEDPVRTDAPYDWTQPNEERCEKGLGRLVAAHQPQIEIRLQSEKFQRRL